MSELLIKNGIVYDPINNIKGEKLDIAIKEGKIVEKVREPKVIDAEERLVLPGGVDMHSHIAGGKVNVGRIMRPEDGRKGLEPRTAITRSGAGYSVVSTHATGYRYARMGYTTVFEAAQPPLTARHTHEELMDIPMVDKGALTLMGNNWSVFEYIRTGQKEKLIAFVAWLLRATKGFGVKIVNPAGVEAWGWGKNVSSIREPAPHFGVTPAEIIRSLAEVNEFLGLPHSIHIHCNRLGHPGNYPVTLDTYDVVKDIKNKERQVMHATHTQFHSYGGASWRDFASKADAIADYINKADNITIDTGAVIFGDTTTMTADGPMEYNLYVLTKRKWSNNDVELETGAGIIPVFYSPKSPVGAIQWAIGLELNLLIKDQWKVMMQTDHPNGGPFTGYPNVIALLMSAKYREEMIKQCHSVINQRAVLPSITRELDWNEIAITTRAGQAKALGLHKYGKGHLGVGADGDVAIYDIKPREFDPSKQYKEVEKAFARAKYTMKGGEIVVKDGEIVKVVEGRTFWTNPRVDEGLMKELEKDIVKKFQKYYSVTLSRYPVGEEYLTQPYEIKVGA
jgi:formylmethanofuran dehydrogenase subunit A